MRKRGDYRGVPVEEEQDGPTLPLFLGTEGWSYVTTMSGFYPVLRHCVSTGLEEWGERRRTYTKCAKGVLVKTDSDGVAIVSAGPESCPLCDMADSGSDQVWRRRLRCLSYIAVLGRLQKAGLAPVRVQQLKIWSRSEKVQADIDRLGEIESMKTNILVTCGYDPKQRLAFDHYRGPEITMGRTLEATYQEHLDRQTLEMLAEPGSYDELLEAVQGPAQGPLADGKEACRVEKGGDLLSRLGISDEDLHKILGEV